MNKSSKNQLLNGRRDELKLLFPRKGFTLNLTLQMNVFCPF